MLDALDVTLAVVELMAVGLLAHALVPLGSLLALLVAIGVWAEVLP